MYKLTKEQMDLLYYEKNDKYDWLKFEDMEDLFYLKTIINKDFSYIDCKIIIFRNGKSNKFYGFDRIIIDGIDVDCNGELYEMEEIVEKTYRRI